MMNLLLIFFLLTAGALESALGKNFVTGEGPVCPIDDPFDREGPEAIDIILDPILQLEEGSKMVDVLATGLSKFSYNIELNGSVVHLQLKMPEFNGKATFMANGYIDARPLRDETIPRGNITGTGTDSTIKAKGIDISARVQLYVNIITGRVTATKLTVEDVKFESIEVDLGEKLLIGGKQINWAKWTEDFKSNLETDIKDVEIKAGIENRIRLAVDQIVEKYTFEELEEIIGGGSGQC